MDQSSPSGVPGPAGRRLHIAHRRSPSEMTPMIMEQLALQQQIELLQAQQQQIAATHQQYINMGIIPQQPGMSNVNFPQGQGLPQFQFQQPMQSQQNLGVPVGTPTQPSSHRRNQSALPNMSMGPPPAPSTGAAGIDYGQIGGQPRGEGSHRGGRGGGSAGSGHQRRHSLALPEAKKAAEIAQQKRAPAGFQFPVPTNVGSSPGGLSPSADGQSDDANSQSSGSGLHLRPGNSRGGSAHGRSQSMAVGGRGGNQAGRGNSSFQFPPPMATNDVGASAAQADLQKRGSGGHGRSASRNFDGNWRAQANGQGAEPQAQPQSQPQQQPVQQQQTQPQHQPMGSFSSNVNPAAASFTPGHRVGRSMNQSVSSIGNFQYPANQLLQGGMVFQQPQMFPGQALNPLQLQQLQALQAAQMSGQFGGLAGSQHAQQPMQQQNQQQRKTLFTPYLPQASLPALLADGKLVSGILRVNKKNRSDAYVTSTDLEADIFICGSKDRNRALEGDFVAIELLDVDEVWAQKREKEEKKKRKDITDTRISGSTSNDKKEGSQNDSQGASEGGLRRRGSLRQRPTQKKNDDVEVEGQSLLLMEEEEINDEQKPLYAGHVVAVVDRIAGQMFSGTLGLLRPSSQATKEKQEAERGHRDNSNNRQHEQHQKPKIVWFKPTDKRVPLIAIPTEQAPRDFVERHQEYSNRIFVACIKRWPITSLHPFGTLVEQLGEMGDLKVETDALLRDNNFAGDEFTDAVLKNVGAEEWSIEKESEETIEARRDLREENTFTIDPTGIQDLNNALHVKVQDKGIVEVGVHVADAAHFIKANTHVDREARKRGTGVYLINRTVNMLPSKLASDICSLIPGQARFTISVIFHINVETGEISDEKTWIGKTIINSSGRLTYNDVNAIVAGDTSTTLQGPTLQQVKLLHIVAQKLRQSRYGSKAQNIPSLRLLYSLDDENVPAEHNIFNSNVAREVIEEICYKANTLVASKIFEAFPEKALLRSHAPPKASRLQTFAERMTQVGYSIDTSTSEALQNSLFKVEDDDMRKGMETLLLKTMNRARYLVAGKSRPDQLPHFALNIPLYTHFTNPSRRYADVIVHRQLEAALSGTEYSEDVENLIKIADQCNTKKDSAHNAQEQSIHIESCRVMDKKREEAGGDLISEGIVICVYESAFDVLIPEYGFEKRVHCDQLPLKKAEFRKETRVLELYWEKGVASSAYIPEDERSKSSRGGGGGYPAVSQHHEYQARPTDTGSMSVEESEALFNDDDDDDASEITEMTAGVSLTAGDRDTQSMPQSPNRGSPANDLHRTQSESKLTSGVTPETKLSDKERYMKMFTLREEAGHFIQDIKEMTRVPIILKTDLSKSPPCLTIRSVNPYAL